MVSKVHTIKEKYTSSLDVKSMMLYVMNETALVKLWSLIQ